MSRFNKYLGDTDSIKDADKSTKVKSISDKIIEDSLFFKYSSIFGKYFFFIKPLKLFAINLGRFLFGKLDYYRTGTEDETKIAEGLTGFLYLLVILSIIVYDNNNKTFSFIILLIGLLITFFNFSTARKFLSLGEIGSIYISSEEVLSLLSWMILLLESGMNLFNAVEYYTSKEKSNLSQLFKMAIEKVKAGKESLDKALFEMSVEIQNENIKEILTLILQSKQQGVSVKDSLYSFFERYQNNLQSIAEKRGSAANQKATFFLTGQVFLLMIILIIALMASIAKGF
ncbi:MAG: type II secretion system F family protein [Candidatus Aenigmatarchaeota archaeon]